MQSQVYIFTIFILDGIIIGLLFDIFRILRRSFKTPDVITFLEDIVFWILTFFTILYSIFKFNNGELRLFIFIGLIIGIILYLIAFSKIFIKVNIYIIKIMKKIINTIILIPIKYFLKFIKKIVFKPVVIISMSTSRNLSKFIEKLKIFKFKKKKLKKQKDFINDC